MQIRHFRTICAIRVVVLTATIFAFIYLLLNLSLYATTALLGLAVVYQVYALNRFVQKTNQELSSFLLSVEHADLARTFGDGPTGSSFSDLRERFSAIMARIGEVRLQREESLKYLQAVVQHVGTGVLVYQTDGRVDLVNAAFKRLLDVPSLRSIESLESISPELSQKVKMIKPGDREMVTVTRHDEILQLSLTATEIRLGKRQLRLLTVQNIGSELSEKEMDAWQNLVRVLTHEIKNSLTPIASLAGTVEEMLIRDTVQNALPTTTDVDEIRFAMQTIQKRSEGLQHLVEAYRSLTHVSKPEFQIFRVLELVQRIGNLVRPKLLEKEVILEYSVEPEDLELVADPQLMEQVIINLVTNSMEAMGTDGGSRIVIRAEIDDRGRGAIRVIDNGPGIEEHALESIFIPFYTTKKHGSGIGLSLSRQIMRLHRGTITVQSQPGEGAVFTLRF